MYYPQINKFSILKENEIMTSDNTSPVSPSEDKTAEPDPLYIFIQNTKDFYVFGENVPHNTLKDYQQAVRKAMTEFGTLCRNKAIEEAIEVVTENGTVRTDLISELNKLKV